MKAPIEWNNEIELFEMVYAALDEAGIRVRSSMERGEYGEEGYLDIIDSQGSRFRLDLARLY